VTVDTLVPTAGVSLRQLLGVGACSAGSPDVWAGSCTHDVRHVRPGDVFVALAGADDDGHDRAGEAAQRGAAAVVCERQVPVFDTPQFVVSDSRIAYGHLCQALVGHPSQQVKVIGVTGTSGKTTVVRLLASVLATAGHDVGTLDSLAVCDGLDRRPAAEAPLAPPLLARSLGRMASSGMSHAIVEISSRELGNQVLAGVTLDSACITQVGRDHLDWHGSLENYRRAKQRILDHLAPEGVAIFNADDAVCTRMLCDFHQPALTIGLREAAEITAEIIDRQINEQTFVVTAGDESVGVRTKMIGDHHVYNCLTAAALGLAHGVELTTVARGLEAVDGVPGRMERVSCGQDFAVLVDAAQSPDTLRHCLRAARAVTTGRLICVFGAGQREQHEWPAMGRVAGAMADVAIVTSNHPHVEDPDAIAAEIRHGFVDPHKAQLISDRVEAIAWALGEARASDTVVVAGMGNRPYASAVDGRTELGDRETVRQLLRGTLQRTAPRRMAA
jgi:UDP-N-acetylmuramoyl-L-alanyl-D-glutamate--2,6-diaminopimelate ligase